MIKTRSHWRIATALTLLLTSCTFPILNRDLSPESTSTPPGILETLLPTPTATLAPTPTPTPEARIATADLALMQGETERARTEYRTGSAGTQDIEIQAAALLGIGRSYLLDRQVDLAIDSFNALIQEHPENRSLPNAYYYLAQAYLERQEYTLAAEALAKYVELKPGIIDDVIQTQRGDALVAGGDYSGAIAAYQAAIDAGPASVAALKLKIGQAYLTQSDFENAVRTFLEILETGDNDFQRAQANLLAGQAYLGLGLPEQAYARYQDSVAKYPDQYDTYSGLVALVNAGQPVSDLDRGVVDYYAGQYGYANEALLRYLTNNPDHPALAHDLRARSLRALDEPQAAIAEWQQLINDHSDDELWSSAWNEIAYTQWAWLDQFDQGAETLLALVALVPNGPDAADALFNAGRILERGGRLTRAAATWERLINEYPGAEVTPRAHLLAGVTLYRLEEFDQALTIFQRSAALGTNPEDQSAALLWVGKTQQAKGDAAAAQQTWQQSASLDPTGYYSVRSSELAQGQPELHEPQAYSLGVDFEGERADAEYWMRNTFTLPAETDFSRLDEVGSEVNFQRGQALWEIGLFQQARGEFETLRLKLEQDPLNTYRLMNHWLSLGAYRPAIFAARQILTLAGMNDTQTLDAPVYFNHIRFGPYYRELVVEEGNRVNLHPLLLLSVIRQESFFEGFVASGADARGLMQVLPATGQEMVDRYNWPPNYATEDLLNPAVNLRLGARYLANQRDYFEDSYVGLAAYNGGPGNANIWHELAGNDPDLFLEIVRFDETRTYLMQIAEFMNLYRQFYSEP